MDFTRCFTSYLIHGSDVEKHVLADAKIYYSIEAWINWEVKRIISWNDEAVNGPLLTHPL
jgi:hypothetical protein